MNYVEDIETLEALYGIVGEAASVKVARRLTPTYSKWIMASRLCMMTTVGPDGTDGSPRGDDGPVVMELDPGTLAMPDWRGNNRLDSLRNIVTDGRISLMFMIPGSNNVMRVNGRARLTADEALRERFRRKSILPATVIVISIEEIYSQCARALLRSGLWNGEPAPADLPTVGDILTEMSEGKLDGRAYDEEWPVRAAQSMW